MEVDTDNDNSEMGGEVQDTAQPLSKREFADVLQNSIIPVVYELLEIHSHVCLEAYGQAIELDCIV